ncbi:PLP-dependent aminotransferase family protein [Aurantimonas sp. A2-1-M11]|uniref:aminotransferase-like domain-containing protein n=1 Tax=Aurantimonas sp. A2-1-M11 TaxID=3113712 RepID=UPI002F931F23
MWNPQNEHELADALSIVDRIARDIERGVLRPGDRLPPQRELATGLGVKLSTISRAYREAAQRRLIGGEIGRGTYVLPSADSRLFIRDRSTERIVDLSTNTPVAMPDDTALATLIQRLSPAERAELSHYHGCDLVDRAKKAISDWQLWRGMRRRPMIVVPCAGAHAALQALLTETTRDGDAILVESLTFPGLKALARQLRLRLIPVEQDGEGIMPEGLDAAARGSSARLAVIVPNMQNPTGAVMSDARRRAIAEVAEQRDLTIIEDDAYGPLSGRPPLARELGSRGIVVSSLSMTVMPGLRFGFVAGDHPMLAALSRNLHVTSRVMTPLSMLAGATWIEDGTAADRTAWQIGTMQERWQQMLHHLGPTDAAPAPHVWLSVDGDAEAAATRLRHRGVAVVPADTFASGRTFHSRVRASLTAAPTDADLDTALRILAASGARLADPPPSGQLAASQ